MKKLIALVAALCLCALCLPAWAEEDAPIVQPFEDGFSLTLPRDWLSYPVPDADAKAGLVYLLSDAEGAHYLCISSAPCALKGVQALYQAMTDRENAAISGDFVTFTDGDAFAAATLMDGSLWQFLFTDAADDEAFRALAEEILASLAPAAEEAN